MSVWFLGKERHPSFLGHTLQLITFTGSVMFLQDPDMKNAAWYAGSCDRRTAEAALLQFNKVAWPCFLVFINSNLQFAQSELRGCVLSTLAGKAQHNVIPTRCKPVCNPVCNPNLFSPLEKSCSAHRKISKGWPGKFSIGHLIQKCLLLSVSPQEREEKIHLDSE